MAESESHLSQAHNMEVMLRTPPSQNKYIRKEQRKWIADFLSEVKKLLVELNKVDLDAVSDEYKRVKEEVRRLLSEEEEALKGLDIHNI